MQVSCRPKWNGKGIASDPPFTWTIIRRLPIVPVRAVFERPESIGIPKSAGLEKVRIGEDVSERLDVTAAKFRVIVTRRPKYAYRGRDGVIQAPAPAHLIEAGIATEAPLAQIAVAKYADGLPLYRQEAIYARDGVELDRSLMAQ